MPRLSLTFCLSSAVIDVDDIFSKRQERRGLFFALRRSTKSSPTLLSRKNATPYNYKVHIFIENRNVLEKN